MPIRFRYYMAYVFLTGAMLLDLEATTMGEIAERVVDQLIITDQLDPVQRDVFMQALLSRHQ